MLLGAHHTHRLCIHKLCVHDDLILLCIAKLDLHLAVTEAQAMHCELRLTKHRANLRADACRSEGQTNRQGVLEM